MIDTNTHIERGGQGEGDIAPRDTQCLPREREDFVSCLDYSGIHLQNKQRRNCAPRQIGDVMFGWTGEKASGGSVNIPIEVHLSTMTYCSHFRSNPTTTTTIVSTPCMQLKGKSPP